MAIDLEVKKGREKKIVPIVFHNGENVLTKNVNLTTVEFSQDVIL
jgi:hypothetical protein